jgi:DNA (cytosine-5)-methyltransferase 1
VTCMNGIIVDNFAGGGGVSLGILQALGRSVDVAINHDDEALALHALNHPDTLHVHGDVWDVDPVALCAGRPVDLAWFSPDCKHFSKAKGAKPVDKKIRGLAWVAIRWARAVKPKVIILENVEEFADWGPLLADGRPCPDRRGLTFRQWCASMRAAGYRLEIRELRACNYGAPTIRKRLFIIARCDGLPIVWPAPMHGPGLLPYLTAADCIDWSLPCPSIFERARPLADKTLARIARGIWRFVLNAADPFIIPVTHGGDLRSYSIREPFRTVTGAHRGELALVQTGYGERPGQAPRSLDLHQPIGTVVAGGAKHALVAAFLAKHYGGHESSAGGVDARRPTATITVRDHHALVATSMVKLMGSCADGQDLRQPAPTIRAQGTHLAEVRAFLTRFNNHGDGQALADPLGTITSKPRWGLVYVAGEAYEIADIGMRMLSPRELYRAQGFPDSYRIDATINGRALSKEAQIRMCGNSVSPPVAAALVRANVAHLAEAA